MRSNRDYCKLMWLGVAKISLDHHHNFTNTSVHAEGRTRVDVESWSRKHATKRALSEGRVYETESTGFTIKKIHAEGNTH